MGKTSGKITGIWWSNYVTIHTIAIPGGDVMDTKRLALGADPRAKIELQLAQTSLNELQRTITIAYQ